MTSPTAIIADDEPHLANHLHACLQRLWPELAIAGIAANGHEALALVEQCHPQIAFLDIRMPGLGGLEVARQIADRCRVVFVSAYEQYALAAFEHAAVDYLLKPVDEARLEITLARLRQSAAPSTAQTLEALRRLLGSPAPAPLRWIKAQSGDSVRLLAVDEICYFQAADKYTLIYTRDAELLIRTSIRELVAQLDPESFWQVHRGTLVNVRQIASARQDALGRWQLRLRDRPEPVTVSRSHAHLFRQM